MHFGCQIKKYHRNFKKILTNRIFYSKILFVVVATISFRYARVAQLVERDLAKVEAAGSSPVSRSIEGAGYFIGSCIFVVEK